jgi:hypothetical protein
MFSRSSETKERLKELVKVTECHAVSFRLRNEVRRLSGYFAIRALLRKYILIDCYNKQRNNFNDPVNKYYMKILIDSHYRSDSSA